MRGLQNSKQILHSLLIVKENPFERHSQIESIDVVKEVHRDGTHSPFVTSMQERELVSHEKTPEEVAEFHETLREVKETLDTLTCTRRRGLIGEAVFGYSPTELATILHKSYPGVKMDICRARKKIRETVKPSWVQLNK